jgi:hypothetical protein
MNNLRKKLQAMKKQVVTVMDQSRKSSDREQTALRQAQEALELKESATANASRAAQHESYMLDLMTDANQDIASMLILSCHFLDILCIFSHVVLFLPCVAYRFVSGCCYRRIESKLASRSPSSNCKDG